MTLGDLSEEDVERIRTGDVSDPTVGQVAALAGVFGVEPSYLMDRGEPLFDGELVEALRNRTIREATREISRLPEKETQLVRGSCGSSEAQTILVLARIQEELLSRRAGLRPSARRPGSR